MRTIVILLRFSEFPVKFGQTFSRTGELLVEFSQCRLAFYNLRDLGRGQFGEEILDRARFGKALQFTLSKEASRPSVVKCGRRIAAWHFDPDCRRARQETMLTAPMDLFADGCDGRRRSADIRP